MNNVNIEEDVKILYIKIIAKNEDNRRSNSIAKVIKCDGFINMNKIIKNYSHNSYTEWKNKVNSKKIIYILKELLIEYGEKYNKKSIEINSARALRVFDALNTTWIHPVLATALAQSLSPRFYVNVCFWIEEWKKYSVENKNKYYKEIGTLAIDFLSETEDEIKKCLAKRLNGIMNLKTVFGNIDVITDDEIIEVEHCDNYKEAFGKIFCFGEFFPTRKKRIYLFGKKLVKSFDMFKNVCFKYDVAVTFEKLN